MGSAADHVHVSRPSALVVESRSPLATATVPVGTVMWKVNVALSEGWSLLGNHEWAPSGSSMVYEPCSVRIHPMGMSQVGRRPSPGVPW